MVQAKGDELAERYGLWLEGKGGIGDYTDDENTYFGTQPSGGHYGGFGGFGRKASGVISLADAAANAAGMKMFKDIAEGKFKGICDYVSDKLDEEVNLNEYTPQMGAVVKKNGRK